MKGLELKGLGIDKVGVDRDRSGLIGIGMTVPRPIDLQNFGETDFGKKKIARADSSGSSHTKPDFQFWSCFWPITFKAIFEQLSAR